MKQLGFQLQIIEGEKQQTRDFPSARALLDFVFLGGGDRGVLRDEEDNHIGWCESAMYSRSRPAEQFFPETYLLPTYNGGPIEPEELRKLARLKG